MTTLITTPIKTKCPNCSACFNLPESLLHKTALKTRCRRCQNVFLVNEHLIVSADNSATKTKAAVMPKTSNNLPQHATNSQKVAQKEQSVADLDTDTVIYDGLQTDDYQNNDEYSDSIDESEHWFDKLKALGNKDYYDNKDHENIVDDTAFTSSDDSWIATFLKEKKDNASTFDSEMNLSQLLTEMGSPPTSDKENNNRHNKSQSTGREAHASIATLLWSTGCLVLVLLLFAQYIIFNLDTLIKNPAHAAKLQAVCSIAACSLPHADLAALSINKLSHQPSSVDPDKTFSDIQADLVNNSLDAQLLPSLKVSIYGADALIGEFIALPEDYLLSAQSQITADHSKPVMFTVPVAAEQIRQVTIDPIY